MWTFEEPGWLLLLLLLPVLWWLRFRWKGRGGRLPLPVSFGAEGLFGASRKGRLWWWRLGEASFWIGLLLWIAGLAGPALLYRERIHLSPGADLMIVLDESPSMAARDFPPLNRFDTARETIRRFVRVRENDAVGLVTFGREAALRVPPTLDYSHFLERLDSLEMMSLGDGTALGMGLALGALHLQTSSARDRIVIALTDGVNNAGEVNPETAASMMAALGIRLYIIGLGSDGPVPLEITDPDSGLTLAGTLEGGFNEALLKQLVTGNPGSAYFTATTAGNLDNVFRAIDSRENAARRTQTQVRTESLHRLLLGVAWLLILAGGFVRRFLLRELL